MANHKERRWIWNPGRENGCAASYRERGILQNSRGSTGALSCSDTFLPQSAGCWTWRFSEAREVSENLRRTPCTVVLKHPPSPLSLFTTKTSPHNQLYDLTSDGSNVSLNITGHSPETPAWLVVANICSCVGTFFIFFKSFNSSFPWKTPTCVITCS